MVHISSVARALATVAVVARVAAGVAPAAAQAPVRTPPPPSPRPDSMAIRRDITYLASDGLAGRLTGSAGNDSAAAYLARRYRALGLRPLSPAYQQRFVARPAVHAGQSVELPTQNVFALLPGHDPKLRGQYVVIGAHFDHLGRSTDGALDPDDKTGVRKGADDNASGTAAVLELARLFAKRPARRSIIFVNFTGEEEGLLGSQYFTEHSPVPLDSVAAMLNFDMVGRLRDDKLLIFGVATATELPAIIDSANGGTGLHLALQGDGFGPSDHSSFYAKGVPVLHFFTDLHDDYHRASDVAEKINAAGEGRVVALAERTTRIIADRPGRLTFVKTAAPATAASAREGSNVYLGSIPDMSQGEVPGLRLTGVRTGSPAELGGLVAGDVIVEFGGKTVKNLYDYSDALYSHQPGDEVRLVVLRKGERVALTVKLGKRGG